MHSEVVQRILARSVRNERGCLICGYMKTHFGHAIVRWRNPKTGKWSMRPAHVLVNEHLHGLIPEGVVVRYTCDTPACVEDDHLLRGSQRDNVHDSITRRRWSLNDAHKWSKLSVDQVKAIRASSLPAKEIAAQFGVTYRHIRYILTGAERKYAT